MIYVHKYMILTCFYCTKHYEITTGHSDIQKHAFYKNDMNNINFSCVGSRKNFLDIL